MSKTATLVAPVAEFTLKTRDLIAGLQAVAPVIPSNPMVTSIGNVLLSGTGTPVGEDGRLYLIATNMETRVVANCAYHSVANFQLLVNARDLLALLKSFPEAPVSFLVDENFVLHLKVGRSSYRLVGENPADFPIAKALAPRFRQVTLPAHFLRQALSATLAIAPAATNVASPFVNGVLLEITSQYVAFVSTSITRLVCFKFDNDDEHVVETVKWGDNDRGNTLIPRTAAQFLLGLLDPKSEAEVTLVTDGVSVRLQGNAWQSRPMDIAFPDYAPIFPTLFTQKFQADGAELLAVLKRLQLCTDVNDAVLLRLSAPGDVRLSADDLVVGNSGEEQVEGEFSGEDLTIAFPAGQLIALLSLFPAGPVRFGFNGPTRPTILSAVPVGWLLEDDLPSMLTAMIAPCRPASAN